MQSLSLEELYIRHGPMVLRRAQAILGDRETSLDVMQEVFISALRASAEFRGQASHVTWLYRITTNLCFNRLRDGGRRAELLQTRHAPTEEPTHTGTSDERLTLTQILRQVPAELVEVGVYYFVDQMSHEEIAELIGVSRRTVGNRVEAFLAHARRLAEGTGEENVA
ncbi:MAG: sigma-70 family RNA polymerase sigma factor [Myxococcaceae bacterium]